MAHHLCIFGLVLVLVITLQAAPVTNKDAFTSSTPTNHRKSNGFKASDPKTHQPIENPKWYEYSIHYMNDSPYYANGYRTQLKLAHEAGFIDDFTYDKERHGSHYREKARNVILNGGIVRDTKMLKPFVDLHHDSLSRQDLAIYEENGLIATYWNRQPFPTKYHGFTESPAQVKHRNQISEEVKGHWVQSKVPNVGRQVFAEEWQHPDEMETSHHRHSGPSSPSSTSRPDSPPLSPPASLHSPDRMEVPWHRLPQDYWKEDGKGKRKEWE
jgi:hypothetical protein